MQDSPQEEFDSGPPIPLLMAADIQDHLMTATHDLERLNSLLTDASEELMTSFSTAAPES